MKKLMLLVLSLVFVFTFVACTSNNEASPSPSTTATPTPLSGSIDIDGSSTVYPLSEAVSEEFGKIHPDVKVTVGVSGTGGGFKRFCAGETAVSNASRKIKAEESEICKAANIEYIELEVAYDGITVVINPENTWAKTLTTEQLKKIFTDVNVKTWKDVDASWPADEIKIYSPGADSGTFDYFKEAIVGKEGTFRNDEVLTLSEDDNVLVQGVEGDKNAIGYFGFSYYEENASKLTAVSIDAGNGAGAIAPTVETINNATYTPLSRTLFVYVKKSELAKPEVKAYATFLVENAKELAESVGFVPLPDANYEEDLTKLQ